jgi:hypothetical protein
LKDCSLGVEMEHPDSKNDIYSLSKNIKGRVNSYPAFCSLIIEKSLIHSHFPYLLEEVFANQKLPDIHNYANDGGKDA